MPASQQFDERHLRDVVLAQSAQIRPARRFSGLEVLTRPVVALTAIVAIVAIALGVRDYVYTPPAASTGTPAIENSKIVTRPTKKSASAKSKARGAATAVSTAERGQAAANVAEKPLIKWDSVKGRTKTAAALDDGPASLRAAAGGDQAEAGMHPEDGADSAGGTITKRGSSECLPLPNGTQPEDVDAPYYFGWATEYCGHDLSRSPGPSKVPHSSKK
ncbi:MAG TPA: hypothetical protein VF133_12135 [Terriglobales bacterium]